MTTTLKSKWMEYVFATMSTSFLEAYTTREQISDVKSDTITWCNDRFEDPAKQAACKVGAAQLGRRIDELLEEKYPETTPDLLQ